MLDIRIPGATPSVLLFLALIAAGSPAWAPAASDHDDTPLLKSIPRHDPRITDLFAFLRDDRLVLAVCLDPTVPPAATSYAFAADLTLSIYVSTNDKVRFNNAADNATYGGTIMTPHRLHEEVTFTMSIDAGGDPQLDIHGLSPPAISEVRFFAGLRDDPFIRGPRIGRNVAAVVIDVPRHRVSPQNKPMLIWATSSVETIYGPFHEHGGRALRSQFVENDLLNRHTPAEHWTRLGVVPDVIILRPTVPVAYPNGRELTDDVVDLVGDPRVLVNDAPFPAANDVPFLAAFPYLAPPHPAP
jgi:hypothetical protein